MKITNACMSVFLLAIVSMTTAARSARKDSMTSSNGNAVMSSTKRMRCPRKCACNSDILEVDCSNRKLWNVPNGIPSSTKSLILSGNKLRFIPKRLFDRLHHLEKLELHGNKLKTFPKRELKRLRKLRKLNLSTNKLENLPSRAFGKLTNLKELLLSNNKLGKLVVDTFAGLNNITEIDLSNNLLQTFEEDMFEGLSTLTTLYLHGNKWHCDCQLKNFERNLREINVRTGYIICDSPRAMAGEHLRDRPSSIMCGPKSATLISIVFGVTLGLTAIFFVLFMCRKRGAMDLEIAEKRNIKKEVKRENEYDKNAESDKETSVEIFEDILPLTSNIIQNEKEPHMPTNEKQHPLISVSDDLCASTLTVFSENKE